MAACALAATLPQLPDGYIGYQFENTAIGFMVVETCFVLLRFYARHVAGTPWSVDDILLPLALVFNYGLQGTSIAMVRKGGIGRHFLWNCVHDPMSFINYAKLQIPFTIILTFAITAAKIAILYMFLRIFVQPVYRYATYAIMAIQVGALISVTVVTCVQCTPISYLWEPQLHPDGHCINTNAFWRWGNFPQIVTDVAILILPLPALLKLKLSMRDRIGVIVTFCTGSIGLVTSIVRFIMFYQIDGQTDATWVASRLGCISIAEAGVYIIAACLPTYRSLIRSVKSRAGTALGTKGLYGSSGSKGTELRSIGKAEKGFERLDHDDKKGSVSVIPYSGPEYSDEQLVPPAGGLRDIQVQRDFYVTSSRK